MSLGALFALGLLLCAALMAGVFALARRLGNFSIVDVAWSLNFTPLVWLYALLGGGYTPRRLLLAVLVSLWSLRLGAHLWTRIARLHPAEEGRYQTLRAEWAGRVNARFFWFFEAQGVLNALLALPFLLAALDPRPALGPLEWAGAALWLVALGGETLADRQLEAFKADPANRGRVCRAGLWRYSRHPNYFFEWLVWVAYCVYAWPSPWGFTSLFAPALMLYFLLRVTGIPATEAQAVRSRGDEYREYQRTTSAFVPWFARG